MRETTATRPCRWTIRRSDDSGGATGAHPGQLEGDGAVVRVIELQRVAQAAGPRRVEQAAPAEAAAQLHLCCESETRRRRQLIAHVGDAGNDSRVARRWEKRGANGVVRAPAPPEAGSRRYSPVPSVRH